MQYLKTNPIYILNDLVGIGSHNKREKSSYKNIEIGRLDKVIEEFNGKMKTIKLY